VRRFKLEYVQTKSELSGLARILLNFKLYVEVLIKGWANAIKVELKAEHNQQALVQVEQRRVALKIPISRLPSNVYGMLTETKQTQPSDPGRVIETDLSSLNPIINQSPDHQSPPHTGAGSPQVISLTAATTPPPRHTSPRNTFFPPPPLSGIVIASPAPNGLSSHVNCNNNGSSFGSIYRPSSPSTTARLVSVEPLLSPLQLPSSSSQRRNT
jgi:hypothetical protein